MQKSVLFLGNSHLSAFSLAYDDIRHAIGAHASFYCARGADLFFTKVAGRTLVALKSGRINHDQLRYFYGVRENAPHSYVETQAPLADVADQLRNTGGISSVNLEGISAIFYIVGMSPYDFVRMGLDTIGMSRWSRHSLLALMLRDHFILRHHIRQIRKTLPDCKHYFVGRPLGFFRKIDCSSVRRKDVVKSRDETRAMARDFLFDDVLMPPEEALCDTLLATKDHFFENGRQESELFQKMAPSRVDHTHVNRSYGKLVFTHSIVRMIEEL